jgi:uncharacterized membrane protein
MNFNEIQDAWDNTKGQDEDLNLLNLSLKNANQPIDSIRKNMKNELYYQLAAIIMIALFPIYFKTSGNALILFYTIFALLLVISFYYFYRFYLLFRSMHNYTANLRENLQELYFEIRLHLEMYKSFSFLLLPFVFFLMGIIVFAKKGTEAQPVPRMEDGADWLFYPIIGVVMTIIVIGLTNWWVTYFYGKYADRIKKTLDELKG